MRVDLTINAVNSKKLLKDYPEVLSIFKTSRDKMIAMEVLSFLEYYDIKFQTVKDPKNKNKINYGLNQVSFFTLVDIIGLIHTSIYFPGFWHSNEEIITSDIAPYRQRLALTKSATREIGLIFKTIGITDNLAYIDNYNNIFCLNKNGLIIFIKMVSKVIHNYAHFKSNGKYL